METIGFKMNKAMRVVGIEYKRRFDLGNFENEDITLTATIDPTDDFNVVAAITELQTLAIKSSIVMKRKAKENK